MSEDTSWLWPNWIPFGHVSMICGLQGSGKSVVATWLAAMVLRGKGRFPDGALIQAGGPSPDGPNWVSWVNTKRTHQLVVDRLTQMGAPLEHARWPVDPDDPEDCQVIDLTQARWLELVAGSVAERRPAWVIVDSLGTRHGEIVPGTARALEAMASIARDVGCAATIIFHLEAARTAGRLRQWAAIASRMKTVMSLKRWGPTTHDMSFKLIKCDLDQRPDPLRIRIEAGVPEVVRKPLVPPQSAVERAASFLEDRLARDRVRHSS